MKKNVHRRRVSFMLDVIDRIDRAAIRKKSTKAILKILFNYLIVIELTTALYSTYCVLSRF